MRHARVCLATLTSLAVAAVLDGRLLAQRGADVGFRDHVFQNPTSSGSRQLPARVFYPSTKTGRDTPLDTHNAPYEVVVFLHGYATPGRKYLDLGHRVANWGYIGIFLDTAEVDHARLVVDGWAMLSSIRQENARAGSFLRAALQVDRVGLLGHSMGGSATIHILANNPGYLAGLAFAPWKGTFGLRAQDVAQWVKAPVALVAGLGDRVTPWKESAGPIYDKLTNVESLRVLFLLDGDANHANVVSWTFPGADADDKEVFTESTSFAGNFLDRYVANEASALEGVIGRAATKSQHLEKLSFTLTEPEYWMQGPRTLGSTVRITIAGSPGLAAHWMAAARVRIPTPFGINYVDPKSAVNLRNGLLGAGGLLDCFLKIPNDPGFRGRLYVFQGFAHARGNRLRYSPALDFTVED